MCQCQAIFRGPSSGKAEYIFREARTAAELEAIFRLRYRVLRGSKISGMCAQSKLELDFDEYETRSHHFGVYFATDEGEILIGCERGIVNRETHVADQVREVANRYGLAALSIGEHPSTPIQGLQYLPDAEYVRTACDEVWGRGGEVVESTRFGIAEEYRSVELSRFMVESTIAVYLLGMGDELGLTSVATHHKAFYYRYGFRQVPGTTDAYLAKVGVEGACLAITRDSIPRVRRERLQSLADQFTLTGAIRIEAVGLQNSRCASRTAAAA